MVSRRFNTKQKEATRQRELRGKYGSGMWPDAYYEIVYALDKADQLPADEKTVGELVEQKLKRQEEERRANLKAVYGDLPKDAFALLCDLDRAKRILDGLHKSTKGENAEKVHAAWTIVNNSMIDLTHISAATPKGSKLNP